MIWSLTLDFKFVMAHVLPGVLPAYMTVYLLPITIGKISDWTSSTWALFLFFCLIFGIIIDTFRHLFELIIEFLCSKIKSKKIHIFPTVSDYNIEPGMPKFDHAKEMRISNYLYWEFHSNMAMLFFISFLISYFPQVLFPSLLLWLLILFGISAVTANLWTRNRLKDFAKSIAPAFETY